MNENELSREIVDAALKVHRKLGPGLLESVYEAVLAHELSGRGLSVNRQVPIPVVYEGLKFEEGFRADLLIGQQVIVELKSIETIMPVHKKQVLTYLKLSGFKLGLLVNFGSPTLKEGIVRLVNGLPQAS